jgi:hypothetical protein
MLCDWQPTCVCSEDVSIVDLWLVCCRLVEETRGTVLTEGLLLEFVIYTGVWSVCIAGAAWLAREPTVLGDFQTLGRPNHGVIR